MSMSGHLEVQLYCQKILDWKIADGKSQDKVG